MQIPILCYHAHILPAGDYAGNGHVALEADLELIHGAGLRIVPLAWIVDWLLGERDDAALENAVGLSFDDGTRLDFEPVDHPELGPLPGFLPILERFARRHPTSQPTVHATCFVIASPRARAEADRQLLFGRDWLDDSWWPAAERSGRISIENHSWDHNMAIASEPPVGPRDCFDHIDSFELAEHEVARASEFLAVQLGRRPALFGYPYGQRSDYLMHDYLPTRGVELGLRAAFSAGGGAVQRASNRWDLPRFVHGHHWRDANGLAALIQIEPDPECAS